MSRHECGLGNPFASKQGWLSKAVSALRKPAQKSINKPGLKPLRKRSPRIFRRLGRLTFGLAWARDGLWAVSSQSDSGGPEQTAYLFGIHLKTRLRDHEKARIISLF